MHCSLPGSSVHGILQARILEWVAISFLKEEFKSRLSGYEIPFFPRHHRNLPPNDDTGIQSANYMKDSQWHLHQREKPLLLVFKYVLGTLGGKKKKKKKAEVPSQSEVIIIDNPKIYENLNKKCYKPPFVNTFLGPHGLLEVTFNTLILKMKYVSHSVVSYSLQPHEL